jgi:hypothetical protein
LKRKTLEERLQARAAEQQMKGMKFYWII